MTAVAERSRPRMLAAAERVTFFFGNCVFLGLKCGPSMGAIAPGLVLGTSACAPPVGSWFEFKGRRGLRWDFRLAHSGTLAE